MRVTAFMLPRFRCPPMRGVVAIIANCVALCQGNVDREPIVPCTRAALPEQRRLRLDSPRVRATANGIDAEASARLAERDRPGNDGDRIPQA